MLGGSSSSSASSSSDRSEHRDKRQKLEQYDLKPLIDFLYFETRKDSSEMTSADIPTTAADLHALLPVNPEDWNMRYTVEGRHHNKTALWLLTEAVCNQELGAFEALKRVVDSGIDLDWFSPSSDDTFHPSNNITAMYYLFQAAMHCIGKSSDILDKVLTQGFAKTAGFESNLNNFVKDYENKEKMGHNKADPLAARFFISLNRAQKVFDACVITSNFQPLTKQMELVEGFANQLLEKEMRICPGYNKRLKRGMQIGMSYESKDPINPWVPFELLKFYQFIQSADNAKRWYDLIKPDSPYYAEAQDRYINLLLATKVQKAAFYTAANVPGSASRAEKKAHNQKRRQDLLEVLKVALSINPKDDIASLMKKTVSALYLSKRNGNMAELNTPAMKRIGELQGPIEAIQLVLDTLRENTKLKKAKK